MRVLVVDDAEVVRSVVRRALEGAGFAVEEATDGAAVLPALRQQPVDLILCDLFMPGQDGVETLNRLRGEFPAVPVVAMSGGLIGGRVDLLPTALALGAVGVLHKPFTTAELLDQVHGALGGKAETPGVHRG